jgi:hypothetical protein
MERALVMIFVATLFGCVPKSAQPKASASAVTPLVSESWKTCAVANVVAEQFSRSLVLLGELERFTENESIHFRVCDPGSLDCNEAAQPFVDACQNFLKLPNRRTSINTSWSLEGIPQERQKPYAILFIAEGPKEITFDWPLRYTFNGSPLLPNGKSLGVLSGVTETRGDLPTIRVVVNKSKPHETTSSAILIGERKISN